MNRIFVKCLLPAALMLLASCGEAPQTENHTQTRSLCDSENVATRSFCPGCMSAEVGQIFVSPVEFEYRPPGAWVYKQVPIVNFGMGKLRIVSIAFDGGGVFSLHEGSELCQSEQRTIAPGEQAVVEVIYHGGEVQGEAQMVIESNDPANSEYRVTLGVRPPQE